MTTEDLLPWFTDLPPEHYREECGISWCSCLAVGRWPEHVEHNDGSTTQVGTTALCESCALVLVEHDEDTVPPQDFERVQPPCTCHA